MASVIAFGLGTGPGLCLAADVGTGGGAERFFCGGVAQLVEHPAVNQVVAGSNPALAASHPSKATTPATSRVDGRQRSIAYATIWPPAIGENNQRAASRLAMATAAGEQGGATATAAPTISDQPVAVLRGHEGITSRRERRGGGRVIFPHTDAAAPATVHGPRRWLDEGLPLRPTSLHTRALRRSPSSPFPAIESGRCKLGRAHLPLRRSA